jgi:hypothetical protein
MPNPPHTHSTYKEVRPWRSGPTDGTDHFGCERVDEGGDVIVR